MRPSKTLACQLAVCAALAALVTHDAEAVYLSRNGAGQVLIFPHYTVRNGFSTLVSIDNTQNNTKVVKLRFREGLNGRDVFDFNLFLSPNDTWTGAVVATSNGAKLITNDNSCVTPADLFTETRMDGLGMPLNAFKNYSYTSLYRDAESLASLDRTREGYFEVIEMGIIDTSPSVAAIQITGFVKQNVAGLPANCAAMDNYDGSSPFGIRFPNIGATLMAPPTGGLRGRASLIGAATGANYSFSPTALDGWSSRIAYSESGRARGAQLSDAFPFVSTVMTPVGLVMATWTNGQDAVSAVLMRDSLTNEFVLDSGTQSQTDWIVTSPTKPYYPDNVEFQGLTPLARAPFTSGFSLDGSGACDMYTFLLSDREASTFDGVPPGIVGVQPIPSPESLSRVCWTSNVVPFSYPTSSPPAVSMLGSNSQSRLSTALRPRVIAATSTAGSATSPLLRGSSQGPNGKLTLRFNQARHQLTPASAMLIEPSGMTYGIQGRHFGLPVIGVMLHNYQNANVISNYGGVVEHSYSVRIE